MGTGAYFRNGGLSSGLEMLSLGMGAQLRDGGGGSIQAQGSQPGVGGLSPWGWGSAQPGGGGGLSAHPLSHTRRLVAGELLGAGAQGVDGRGGECPPPGLLRRVAACSGATPRPCGEGAPACLPPPPPPNPGTVRAPNLAQASGKAPGPGGGRRWSTRGSRPCPWRWSWGAACTRAPGSGRPGAAPGGHRSCRRGRGAGTGRAAGTLRGTGGTVGTGPPSVPSPPRGTLPSPPYSPTLVGSPYLGPGLL